MVRLPIPDLKLDTVVQYILNQERHHTKFEVQR
jgi:hypothetical protein